MKWERGTPEEDRRRIEDGGPFALDVHDAIVREQVEKAVGEEAVKWSATIAPLRNRIAALEAEQESDHAWIDADALTKEAQQNEIRALEAALERADALVDLLLDQTLYPMKYEAGLRCAINNYDAARAKVKP